MLASGERRQSFIIAANHNAFDWPVNRVHELTTAHCEPLLALRPDVVLLGTGASLTFPQRDILAAFLMRRIGIECMDNAAAARTYNLLLGEGRNVACAFLLP